MLLLINQISISFFRRWILGVFNHGVAHLTGVAPGYGTGEKDLVSYLTAPRFTAVNNRLCGSEAILSPSMIAFIVP